MTLEQKIHKLASEGHSRKSVADILGVSKHKFRDMLACMPEVDWPAKGHCLVFQARQEVYTPALRRALEIGRAKKAEKYPRYQIGSNYGTIRELHGIYGDLTTGSVNAIRHRVKVGRPLLDAFFR